MSDDAYRALVRMLLLFALLALYAGAIVIVGVFG